MLRELRTLVDYIEDHLTQPITMEELAELSNLSLHQLRTVFFHLCGFTLQEYIRGRRLSCANQDLLQKETVTTVAYKYGYESLDGFTRAFKAWSGVLPSDVNKTGIHRAFPKLSFLITVQGGTTMEYRIEQKEAFRIAGVKKRVKMQFEGVNEEIVALAQSITPMQREQMHALQNMEPKEVVNASFAADGAFQKEEGYLTHMIGVLTTSEQISEQLEYTSVQSSTWAVFPNKGPFPATLQQTMASIYAQWLPSADYELADLPTFSFTRWAELENNQVYSEIWIPVKQK